MVTQKGITGNDYVKCKLTETGLEILRARAQELRNIAPKMPPWTPPKLDSNGFYETQLWCLMDDFGRNCLGGLLPFTDFIVPLHEAEYYALAERCERLEAALRACDAVLANLGCDEDNSPRAEVKDILGDSP